MWRIKAWGDELWFQILVNGLLFAVMVIIAAPVWRVLMMSVTPMSYINDPTFGMLVPPWHWTLAAYEQLLGHPQFLRAAGNSAFVTGVGTTVNMLLTVPLAYVLSVRTLPGRRIIVGLMLFTFLFHTGLVPVYLVVTKLNLYNSLPALFLPTAVSVYNTLIMKGFFEGLPEDLKEAARMDGANELDVLLQIILPLSKPILLTIGLFYAVGHWNEFFAPILYLNDSKLFTLPVLLRNILQASSMSEYIDYNAYSLASVESLKAAGVFITMLPMVIVYPWIQRYFTKGTLAGALKQ